VSEVDWADKIAKLLRKAEDTDNPHEAEAFTEKAQELMTQYAITEAMLREREDKPAEEIVEETIECAGVHRHVLKSLAGAIVDANACQWFYRNFTDSSPRRIDVVTIGYESDVARIRLLHTSVQLQLEVARTKWVAEHPTLSTMSRTQKRLARRDFGFGFVDGLRTRLSQAAEAGQRDAAEVEAERSGATVSEASESVAMIVRSRADNVQDWYDEKWGGELRTVRTNYKSSYTDGRGAGEAAGASADISLGGDRVSGGSAPALGAG